VKKALATLIVLLLAGCGSGPEPTGEAPVSTDAQGKTAPEFELERVSGGTLKSSDLKGKVVIVDFWATWCDPCIAEIPNYNMIQETYAARGVEVLGITVESGPLEDIRPKVEDFQMKYPVVVGDEAVVAGFGGLIGFPTTFIVDQQGKLYKKYLGMTRNKKEAIEKDLEKLLASGV
jgi:thiol-disulfide isomerase/thioredoxin